MKMSGTQIIQAPRAVVWKGLNDPKILQKCIPGCDKIESASPTDMKATVVVKVGPVKASFAGEVKLSDIKPPESYRISGQGQGGFAGHASGGASVKLSEISATETQMDYDVDAQIGGKLAMLGSRLIDSTAKSLADQFFTKFAGLMKAEGAASLPAKPKPTKKPVKKVVKAKASRKVAKKSAKSASKKKSKTK